MESYEADAIQTCYRCRHELIDLLNEWLDKGIPYEMFYVHLLELGTQCVVRVSGKEYARELLETAIADLDEIEQSLERLKEEEREPTPNRPWPPEDG